MTAEGYRRYTAGFLFKPIHGASPTARRVLLVRKSHPKWQAGMLNAIGGEFEEGEDGRACIKREFHEEANLLTDDWDLFCTEMGPGYEVHFYRHTLHPDAVYKAPAKNDKDEDLDWHDADVQKYPVIGNLNWLLPLARDPRPINCVMRTEGDIRKIVTW